MPVSNQKTFFIGVAVVCALAGSSYAAYRAGYRSGAGTVSVPAPLGGQPAPLVARVVLGKVESISGQEITLKDFRRVPDLPAGSTAPSNLVVVVDQNTSIERLVPKNPAVLDKERAAYIKKLQEQGVSTTTLPIAPLESFTRVEISLGDVKVGDALTIFSAEDIANTARFTATRIELQAVSVIPAAPEAR